MLECDYIVKQIDGDYAHLQRGRTQACGESTTAG